MKKNEVKIGHTYQAKVSDRIVTVRIDSTHSHGGWNATNTATGKRIHIKSPQRLQRAVGSEKKRTGEPAGQTPGEDGIAAARADAKAATQAEVNPTVEVITGQPLPKKTRAKKAAAEPKPKRISALDAAAEVLKDAAKPMRAKDLIETMAARGPWTSPNGKTPEATLYAAILREIAKAVAAGTVSRFRKVDRGQFAFNASAKA